MIESVAIEQQQQQKKNYLPDSRKNGQYFLSDMNVSPVPEMRKKTYKKANSEMSEKSEWDRDIL